MKTIKAKQRKYENPWDLKSDKTVPLVPQFIFFFLMLVSLMLPNLIFSGVSWYDTLHIMKWAWTMVPVALISITGGVILAVYGTKRTDFRLDAFGAAWFALVIYVSIQPLWVNITGLSTYTKEWFFFATLFTAYVFCYNLFNGEKMLRIALWGSIVNASLNTVFAEILIRNLNEPFWFIMNVPGNYIGNTGQQEMFGLWLGIAVMNGIFLHTAYYALNKENPGKFTAVRRANIFFLAVNAWGLWNSTTRGGMIAMVLGVIVMALSIYRCGKSKRLIDELAAAAAVAALILIVTITAGKLFDVGRASSLVQKTGDMAVNFTKIGNRDQIWKSTFGVIKQYPVGGVGIGHYKWHYLNGQREAMNTDPDMRWQFTYWAHNEYLQWQAEFGVFGTFVLLVGGLLWLGCYINTLRQKKPMSDSVIWACSFVFLIGFDAIFSRPFHRIEIIIWLPLALAISNRFFMPKRLRIPMEKIEAAGRILGVLFVGTALLGLAYLLDGCIADKRMRAATLTNNAQLQRALIEKARESIMERDEAEVLLAKHLLVVANSTKNPEDMKAAELQLIKAYQVRPEAKQLVDIYNTAIRLNDEETRKKYYPLLERAISDQK
ncbi:MAG: O-antigen ligase family protein [Synergistes sp.]|nr:O-antigen ligase family protein [Synergistes sp.]